MIIFIWGADIFNAREKLRDVIRQFQEKRDSVGLNVVRLDGDKLDFARLRQEVMTQGFLSPKKMIVVENLLESNNVSSLEQTLELAKKYFASGTKGEKKTADQNVLVFWESGFQPKKKTKADQVADRLFTFLKKQDYVYHFPELSSIMLEHWIKQRVTTLSGKISQPAVRMWAALAGKNLYQMANDIDKLLSYKNSKEISVTDVEQNVRNGMVANIFALTDAIASQDRARALKLLKKELADGANELYLLTMIARQFRILLQLQAKLADKVSSPDKLAKELKLHPFVVKKSLAIAKKYTLDQLKAIYGKLVNIDQSMKISHPNPQLLLDLLIVS